MAYNEPDTLDPKNKYVQIGDQFYYVEIVNDVIRDLHIRNTLGSLSNADKLLISILEDNFLINKD